MFLKISQNSQEGNTCEINYGTPLVAASEGCYGTVLMDLSKVFDTLGY